MEVKLCIASVMLITSVSTLITKICSGPTMDAKLLMYVTQLYEIRVTQSHIGKFLSNEGMEDDDQT